MRDAAANRTRDRLAIRADQAFDGRAVIPGGALVLCADGKIVGVEPPTAPVPEGGQPLNTRVPPCSPA